MPYVMNDRPPPRPDVTPWFSLADHPVRDGRYQVRLCPGWRVVYAEWRRGAWWIAGDPGRPNRLRLMYWPQFVWRGLASAGD